MTTHYIIAETDDQRRAIPVDATDEADAREQAAAMGVTVRRIERAMTAEEWEAGFPDAEPSTYTVLGLSEDGQHVELADHHTQAQCFDWIEGYIRWGDWGGYYGLAIIAPDGEWLEELNAPEPEEAS